MNKRQMSGIPPIFFRNIWHAPLTFKISDVTPKLLQISEIPPSILKLFLGSQLPLTYYVVKASFRAFADRYFSLTDMEMRTESSDRTLLASTTGCEKRCVGLANTIDNCLDTVGDAYDSSPEQVSILILSLFELCVSMDNCATKVFPLLK
jgi:hypothetical protein